MLSYTKSLSGIFRHLGICNQSLLSLAAALRAVGAAIPCQQAMPMEKHILVAWAFSQSPRLCLAALIAWKTASRWTEVSNLSSANFLLVKRDEVVIDWFTIPKGRRAMPFTHSRWVVIKGDLTEAIFLLLTSLPPFQRLTSWTTTKLVGVWRRSPQLSLYSAHSIKRGALTYLFKKVAAGHLIPEVLLSRLAKHKVKEVEGLAEVTLRYGGDPLAMARALRTDKVTALL
ncbi:hypothetical protein DIPPA_16296 [Diplonema papillatum]|nr:hypothetical protein DIPPA_24920 [Diplonema papillatum]KAJ9444187.1 hypothetical protein DIPPA_14495 [Diplonema papillatum]KAJ9450296.1 hypothetical protein DIPPA_16296 [Diplonema papillatum]